MNNSFTKKTSTMLSAHCLRSRGGSRGRLGPSPP